MPTSRRRSRDNVPQSRSPQSTNFPDYRLCFCGEKNSNRRTYCTACGRTLKCVVKRKRAYRRRSSGAMDTGSSQEQPMDTAVDSQEAATTAEEGSAASSPRSHEPHSSHQSPPTHTPSTPSEERSTSEVDARIQNTSSSRNSPESQQNSPSLTNGVSPPTPSQESHPPLAPQQSQPTSPPTPQESRHISPPPSDFLTALGMKPSTSSQHAPTSTHTSSLSEESPGDGVGGGVGGAPADEEMETDNKESSLRERYNNDPNDVLDLLKSALSLERISQLLNSEQTNSIEQLDYLQGKLDAAYQTLKHCTEHKAALTKSIEETSEKIKGKRRHLESLREDLRVLGEEEMALKKRRDSAHSQCAQLKQKLKASREALQQISALERNDSVQSRDTS